MVNALATANESRNDFNKKKKRKDDLNLLKGEEESRGKRIKDRKKQQKKIAAARAKAKRIRNAKLAAVWVFVIFAGFMAFGWFSGDLVKTFHKLINWSKYIRIVADGAFAVAESDCGSGINLPTNIVDIGAHGTYFPAALAAGLGGQIFRVLGYEGS